MLSELFNEPYLVSPNGGALNAISLHLSSMKKSTIGQSRWLKTLGVVRFSFSNYITSEHLW